LVEIDRILLRKDRIVLAEKIREREQISYSGTVYFTTSVIAQKHLRRNPTALLRSLLQAPNYFSPRQGHDATMDVTVNVCGRLHLVPCMVAASR